MSFSFKFESSVKVPHPEAEDVIVSIDGSRRGKAHSSAYLSTDGSLGVVAAEFAIDRCQPHCANSTELRAAYYALARLVDKRVTLVSDSKTTVDWIERWQEGDDALPRWYNLERKSDRRSTIESLRNIVASRALDLTIMHTKGHAGDLLNEAVDCLAGVGSNVVNGVYDREEGRKRTVRVAESFLLSYRQS